MKRGRDSVGVPNAVGKVTFSSGFNRKSRGYAGKGRGHSDPGSIARFRNEQTLGVKMLECAKHLLFAQTHRDRYRRRIRDDAGLGDDGIECELYLNVQCLTH